MDGHCYVIPDGQPDLRTDIGVDIPDGSIEKCNDVDDDEDGQTDEDFDVGQPCDGIGECGAGTWECADESSTRCSTDPGGTADESQTETCDTLDNDCDTLTDESFGIGGACDGVGECGAGTIECADATSTRCSTDPGGSADESQPDLCNGADDDCDPSTPDGSAEVWYGDPCDGPDVGLCEEGTLGCDGVGQVCSDTTTDDPDLCNGADDDCDPSTPDGSAEVWYGDPCDGPDVGLCEEGAFGCDGVDQICSDTTTDDFDLCNGSDDDCDPATANGSAEPWYGDPCDGPDVGLCEEGTLGCDGVGQACSDATTDDPDLCNAADDDCDPATANGSAESWYGDPCTGVGECGAGVLECAASGTRCSTDPGGSQQQGQPESCDGLDNDCDGQVDETAGVRALTAVDAVGDVGQYTSVAIGSNGLPVIAYHDVTNGDLKIAVCTSADCSTNTLVTSDDDGGGLNVVGFYASLAVDSNGLPTVSHEDRTFRDLKVTKCSDPTCSGVATEVVAGDGAGPALFGLCAMAIPSDDLPVIAHLDNVVEVLRVAKCGDAACSSGNNFYDIDTLEAPARGVSIAIGADLLPVMSHVRALGGPQELVVSRCLLADCSTGATNQIVDSDTRSFSTSIAIGADGFPIVAYEGDSVWGLRVVKCGNADCSSGNTLTTVDAGRDVRYVSIAIGADGFPVIAYEDNSDLWVAKCADAACSTPCGAGTVCTAVDTCDSVGHWNSIAVPSDGLPIISYYDATNGDLKVLKCATPSCARDRWTATSVSAVPSARTSHVAVWTGAEMVMWSGGDDGAWTNTGGRYDPTTDTWTATSSTNAPQGRRYATAVWTGTEMLAWGGNDGDAPIDTGGEYDPIGDSWSTIPTTDAPAAREAHTAIWTGTEMIVWGGFDAVNNAFDTGGRYEPSTDTWTPTTVGAPAARGYHVAVWTGSEMIVWGGSRSVPSFLEYPDGMRYDPLSDSWSPMSSAGAPTWAFTHAVWTGTEMLLWGGCSGGNCSGGYINETRAYDPVADSWRTITNVGAPAGREQAEIFWTGSDLLVWGGADTSGDLDTGGRYSMAQDTWFPITLQDAPSPRRSLVGVWSGSEMIVWGGRVGPSTELDTGGRYTP